MLKPQLLVKTQEVPANQCVARISYRCCRIAWRTRRDCWSVDTEETRAFRQQPRRDWGRSRLFVWAQVRIEEVALKLQLGTIRITHTG